MKKLIDIRFLLIGLCIAGLLSLIAMKWFGAPFWISFILIVLAMYINGLIADHEDRKPGEFEKPVPTEKQDEKKS